jgi:hypothetical protein
MARVGDDRARGEEVMTPETIAGYRIHPAANLFPLMSEAELQELADDIKQHGQHDHILYVLTVEQTARQRRSHASRAVSPYLPDERPNPDEVMILDGRNRLLACELAGVEPQFRHAPEAGDSSDPIAFVISKNLQRRHLTAEQKAAIVLKAAKLSGELAKLEADAQERKQANLSKASREGVEPAMKCPRPGWDTEAEAKAWIGRSHYHVEKLCGLCGKYHVSKGKTAAKLAEQPGVSRATVERVSRASWARASLWTCAPFR